VSTGTIVLKDCGPVAHLEIPVQPGATILRGTSDLGKSETLKAISRLAGGDDDVTCREGAARGSVEGFGVKLGLTKTTRRTGQLEVLAVEEGFGLGTLIDGDGLKQPERADAARIKALLRISGVKADPAAFHSIMPGGKDEFDKLVPRDALETDDVVELARRIKAAMDSQARALEKQADTEEGKAQAYRNAGDGLDLNASTDAASLQRDHTEAVQDYATIKAEWDAWHNAQEAAKAAREKLAAATGGGKTVAEYQAEEETKKTAYNAAIERVKQLRADLLLAESESKAAYESHAAAKNQVESARQTAAATAGWQEAIDAAAGVKCPQAETVEAMKRMVDAAQKAIEDAGVIREAQRKVGLAKEHTAEAEKLRDKAKSLRNAGRETDAVMSALVASPYLKVYGGRLVTEVEGRGQVLFHDRSDGTRTRIACMEKLHRIREINSDQLALIPIGQRQFGDLSPAARKELIQWAYDNNACIVSAVVDDSPELTAEAATPLDPSPAMR